MTDIHSNAAAYAVGGLEMSEVAEFEQHLTECADCREEVAEMRELSARMSAAVATDPPPHLRGSVLSMISTTAQDTTTPAPAPAPAPLPAQAPAARPAGRHAAPVPVAETSDEVSPPIDITKRRSWVTRASALVAAAAVVGAIAVGWTTTESRNDARDETAAAQQQLERLASVLSAEDVQTASATVDDGGKAVVVRSVDQGVALLFAANLPDLPDDKVYEAWTFDGDTPVPAGTFTTESAEPSASVLLPPGGVDTSTVAVTVEPEGGSDQPTTDPIAVIDLA